MVKRAVLFWCVVMGLCAIPTYAAPDAPKGTLYIPAINLVTPITDAPIAEGEHQIGDGVGHLAGTVWVTADWGRVVLAGHSPGIFERLHDLKTGDSIWILTGGELYTYEVANVMITTNNTRWLMPTDYHMLTLITCYERGQTWLVVNAKAVR